MNRWRIVPITLLLLLLSNCGPSSAQATNSGPFIGPDTIADLVVKVAPAVVNINATTNLNRDQVARQRTRVRDGRPKLYADPPAGDYMKMTGSGVIIRPEGYILTSLHVVENAIKIEVSLQDGRNFEANVISRDRFSDLALIKIPAQNLPVGNFGSANTLRLGDWVVAIGNQFGLGHTVTHGLISGLAREAKGFDRSFGAKTGAVRFIQTDAPINPGSSGGPLVNLKGEIVGINTFIRDDAQNIGFAIPADLAREVGDKLVSGQSLAHPYIGIVMKEPNKDVIRTNEQLLANGVEVIEVKFRSPASRAGIVPGDVILSIGETPISNSDEVSKAVGGTKIGTSLKLKIKRSGVEKVVDVQVDQLPEESE